MPIPLPLDELPGLLIWGGSEGEVVGIDVLRVGRREGLLWDGVEDWRNWENEIREGEMEGPDRDCLLKESWEGEDGGIDSEGR